MSDNRYRAFWRWHFYAGVLVLPFMAWLAITGGLYLFKPEIERAIYGSWVTLDAPATALPVSRLIADTERQAQGEVTQIEVPSSPTESWRMRVESGDAVRTAFVDPASGALLGTTSEGGIMKTVRDLHSLAITAPIGNALIEIAAGFAIILVVTGIVLWWPRDGRPVLALRRPVGRRRFWRDFHASTGILAAAIILFLAVTGMPWSVVWGANVQRWVGEQGLGRPKAPGPQPWERAHKHQAGEARAAALPWSLQQAAMPHALGLSDVGVDRAVAIATQKGLAPPFTIMLPLAPSEPYSISSVARRVQDVRAIYVDPSSGRVLQDAKYAQFGKGAQAIEWGIATHQGQQYGEPNRWLMLAGCLSLLALAISSPVMWWKRRNQGKLQTPPRPTSASVATTATATVIFLGLIYPLTGATALLIWLFDQNLLPRLQKK